MSRSRTKRLQRASQRAHLPPLKVHFLLGDDVIELSVRKVTVDLAIPGVHIELGEPLAELCQFLVTLAAALGARTQDA
jgi:hypothetical protein